MLGMATRGISLFFVAHLLACGEAADETRDAEGPSDMAPMADNGPASDSALEPDAGDVIEGWVESDQRAERPRASMGFAAVGESQLVLVGGKQGGMAGATLSDIEIFDSRDGTFSSGPDLNVARSMPSTLALADGRILITGGVGADGAVLDGCEVYDPIAGTVQSVAPMANPRARHKIDLLPDGRALVTGGTGLLDIMGNPLATIGAAHATTEIYDPVDDIWRAGPDLVGPRLVHATAVLPGGDILIAGGLSSAGGPPSVSSRVERFEVATGTVRALPDMPTGRAEHTMTALLDGRVLISGGGAFAEGGGFGVMAVPSADLFDPVTEAWTEAAPMETGRAGHLGLRTRDGRVVCPAGDSGSLFEMTPTATTEVYDPIADRWDSGPPLPAALVGYAGRVDGDGRLIVVGGTDGAADSDAAYTFEP